MKKIIFPSTVVLELLISAYVAFLGYFLSSWFIDDSVAARLIDNDWNKIAVTRIFYSIIIAALITTAAFILNKYILSHCVKEKNSKKPLTISIAIFFMIVIPSIVGAIEFAMKKPFM